MQQFTWPRSSALCNFHDSYCFIIFLYQITIFITTCCLQRNKHSLCKSIIWAHNSCTPACFRLSPPALLPSVTHSARPSFTQALLCHLLSLCSSYNHFSAMLRHFRGVKWMGNHFFIAVGIPWTVDTFSSLSLSFVTIPSVMSQYKMLLFFFMLKKITGFLFLYIRKSLAKSNTK